MLYTLRDLSNKTNEYWAHGVAPVVGNAQDGGLWAHTTNKLQVTSGRLGRSGLRRGVLRGYVSVSSKMKYKHNNGTAQVYY
jgi:hypothetical protein